NNDNKYSLMNKKGKKMTYQIPTPTTHPGLILQETIIVPYGLTQAKLADLLNVGINTINEIIKQKRSITPSMALKLSKLFDTTPQFWLHFQNGYDLYRTYEDEKESLDSITPFSG
ncbi:MAG: HigA family addiction module antitoxin, partial [Vampirovibrionia bacterium]